MLSKCPNCSTTFRVTPAQLKARAGKVRCGQCNFVFNALETLAEEPVKVPAEAPSTEPVLEPLVAIEPANEPAPAETSVMSDIVSGDSEAVADEIPLAAADETEDEADNDIEEPAPEPAAAASSQAENYFGDTLLHQPAAKTWRWPWVLGSIVAILSLLAQAAYYYRVELAVLRPDWRPLLQAACQPLQCDVPRPRSIDTLGIETSDMRPDPLHPGHLTLTATLRSKAVYAQEWPLLELTLTDVSDHTLAVKHFAASDYLPRDKDIGRKITAGFPANGEIAVTLPLDAGNLPASGYRLYIFYP